jgi:apolipoprotein D and lipocalin family protein
MIGLVQFCSLSWFSLTSSTAHQQGYSITRKGKRMVPFQFHPMSFSRLCCCLLFAGCSIPKELSTESIPVVKNFDLNRYLGTWYEVARLPHSFENGLDSVTATYSLRDDGQVVVLNKGFQTSQSAWKEAVGKARFKGLPTEGFLEVSFFWIFYADYKIIDLDTVNYSYAMITSSSKKYLWILSRTPHLEQTVYDSLLGKAKEWDFNISEIYKVVQ